MWVLLYLECTHSYWIITVDLLILTVAGNREKNYSIDFCFMYKSIWLISFTFVISLLRVCCWMLSECIFSYYHPLLTTYLTIIFCVLIVAHCLFNLCFSINHSPTCFFKPVFLSFFSGTQHSRTLMLLQWKWMVARACQAPKIFWSHRIDYDNCLHCSSQHAKFEFMHIQI